MYSYSSRYNIDSYLSTSVNNPQKYEITTCSAMRALGTTLNPTTSILRRGLKILVIDRLNPGNFKINVAEEYASVLTIK